MDAESARKFGKEWVDAWNAHDLDRILSHYAEELHYSSPLVLERIAGSDGVIRDRRSLKAYVQTGLAKNPDLWFSLREVLLGAHGVTLYYDNARGGRTAEYFEFDTAGEVIKVIACYSP